MLSLENPLRRPAFENAKPMPKSNTKKQIDEDDGWFVGMKSAVALLGGLTLVVILVGVLLVSIWFQFE